MDSKTAKLLVANVNDARLSAALSLLRGVAPLHETGPATLVAIIEMVEGLIERNVEHMKE